MAGFHVIAGSGETLVTPTVRRVSPRDLLAALKAGLSDFNEKPSHYAFICVIYPLVGVVLIAWTRGENALPMLFPLMSGFALLGPLAAIGLYEISRRRERGEDTSWRHALEVLRSPAVPSICAVGFLLFVLFVAWLLSAKALYVALFGPVTPASLSSFLHEVVTTRQGWALIVFGNAIGFVYAVIVLSTTVVAFPLLLDRDVGAYEAVATSTRVVIANPGPMALWGVIVAAALAIASIPAFMGLAVAVPILGHATWHLYRRAVEPPSRRAGRR